VLWSEAAALGDSLAMFHVGMAVNSKRDPQRYQWLGKAARRGLHAAVWELQQRAVHSVQNFDCGSSPELGMIVFEIGAAIKGLASELLVSDTGRTKFKQAALRCVELHDRCTNAAIAAISCWIGVGLRLAVVKDIRVLIAKMLWEKQYACIKH
jgi:hypothetical protein